MEAAKIHIKIEETHTLQETSVKPKVEAPGEYTILEQDLALSSIVEQIIRVGDPIQGVNQEIGDLEYLRNIEHIANTHSHLGDYRDPIRTDRFQTSNQDLGAESIIEDSIIIKEEPIYKYAEENDMTDRLQTSVQEPGTEGISEDNTIIKIEPMFKHAEENDFSEISGHNGSKNEIKHIEKKRPRGRPKGSSNKITKSLSRQIITRRMKAETLMTKHKGKYARWGSELIQVCIRPKVYNAPNVYYVINQPREECPFCKEEFRLENLTYNIKTCTCKIRCKCGLRTHISLIPRRIRRKHKKNTIGHNNQKRSTTVPSRNLPKSQSSSHVGRDTKTHKYWRTRRFVKEETCGPTSRYQDYTDQTKSKNGNFPKRAHKLPYEGCYMCRYFQKNEPKRFETKIYKGISHKELRALHKYTPHTHCDSHSV